MNNGLKLRFSVDTVSGERSLAISISPEAMSFDGECVSFGPEYSEKVLRLFARIQRSLKRTAEIEAAGGMEKFLISDGMDPAEAAEYTNEWRKTNTAGITP